MLQTNKFDLIGSKKRKKIVSQRVELKHASKRLPRRPTLRVDSQIQTKQKMRVSIQVVRFPHGWFEKLQI